MAIEYNLSLSSSHQSSSQLVKAKEIESDEGSTSAVIEEKETLLISGCWRRRSGGRMVKLLKGLVWRRSENSK